MSCSEKVFTSFAIATVGTWLTTTQPQYTTPYVHYIICTSHSTLRHMYTISYVPATVHYAICVCTGPFRIEDSLDLTHVPGAWCLVCGEGSDTCAWCLVCGEEESTSRHTRGFTPLHSKERPLLLISEAVEHRVNEWYSQWRGVVLPVVGSGTASGGEQT